MGSVVYLQTANSPVEYTTKGHEETNENGWPIDLLAVLAALVNAQHTMPYQPCPAAALA